MSNWGAHRITTYSTILAACTYTLAGLAGGDDIWQGVWSRLAKVIYCDRFGLVMNTLVDICITKDTVNHSYYGNNIQLSLEMKFEKNDMGMQKGKTTTTSTSIKLRKSTHHTG